MNKKFIVQGMRVAIYPYTMMITLTFLIWRRFWRRIK